MRPAEQPGEHSHYDLRYRTTDTVQLSLDIVGETVWYQQNKRSHSFIIVRFKKFRTTTLESLIENERYKKFVLDSGLLVLYRQGECHGSM